MSLESRFERLALAHIATEQWIHEEPVAMAQAYAPDFLCRIHRHLFGQLSDADRIVRDVLSACVEP